MEFSNQPVNVPKLAGKSPERELAYWNDVKTSGDVSQLLVFITNFPEGTYVEPAVELYKQKCGDLTQLPSIVLTCKPADLSVAPKRRKFLPPPKIVTVEPPKVEYVPPIVVRHRRKPPVIVVGKDHPAHSCKNGNYIGAANCGDPPNEPFGGSHGAGKEGTSGGNTGPGPGRGNIGNTGGTTPGKP